MKLSIALLSLLAASSTAFQSITVPRQTSSKLSASVPPEFKLSDAEMKWFTGNAPVFEQKEDKNGLEVELNAHRRRLHAIEDAIADGLKELPHQEPENKYNLHGIKKQWYTGELSPHRSSSNLPGEKSYEQAQIEALQAKLSA